METQGKIIAAGFSGGLMPPFTGVDVGAGQTETGGLLVSLQQAVQTQVVKMKSCSIKGGAGIAFTRGVYLPVCAR